MRNRRGSDDGEIGGGEGSRDGSVDRTLRLLAYLGIPLLMAAALGFMSQQLGDAEREAAVLRARLEMCQCAAGTGR